MLKRLISLFRKRSSADKERAVVMDVVKRATARGQCVILAETPAGTRIIVFGKDNMTRQLEEISKSKGVQL